MNFEKYKKIKVRSDIKWQFMKLTKEFLTALIFVVLSITIVCHETSAMSPYLKLDTVEHDGLNVYIDWEHGGAVHYAADDAATLAGISILRGYPGNTLSFQMRDKRFLYMQTGTTERIAKVAAEHAVRLVNACHTWRT